VAASPEENSHVGLMLYTVRDECAKDLERTLESVAAMGYEGVEVFDFHGRGAGRIRELLDERELAIAGRHVSLDAVETRLSELAAEAAELGTSRIVVSWIEPPAGAAEAEATAARLERAAEAASELGVELGFHNHDGEVRPLEDGRSLLERLAEGSLFLELDLGWAWWAGADPVELLQRVRGRTPLVHVKDFRARGERSFCPVGDGGVGYERVAPAAVRAGVEWLLVEQDEADGSSLEAARRSLLALRSMLAAA
jgi:sugar phosphate isomerase/epimerase